MKTSLYFCAFLTVAGLAGVPAAAGQESAVPLQYSSSAAAFSEELPDAPSAVVTPGFEGALGGGQFAGTQTARKYKMAIRPDEIAQPLTAGDKFKLSIVNQLSFATLASTTVSAGLSHIRDGRPHYGVDMPAFGERFGASALRGMSQSVISIGILAPIFHDDPRYYVMGPGNKFSKRAVYAATRLIITKKDDGSSGVNWARIGGIAGAGALTNAYYPDRDRGGKETAYSILSTLGTTALTFELREFVGDLRDRLRHKK